MTKQIELKMKVEKLKLDMLQDKTNFIKNESRNNREFQIQIRKKDQSMKLLESGENRKLCFT